MKYLKNPYVLLAVIFVLSRIFYIQLLHIQFESDSIDYYLQYLDPELLRENLLQSILYLHQQPPLFNFYLGIILQAFPQQYSKVFQICYLAIGLLFSFHVFALMKELGVQHGIALILSVLFIISPTTVLHENWLFYGYPVAFALCASALYLAKFINTNKITYGFLFFSLLAILILTRSLFRPEEIFIAAGLLLFFCKKNRRAIMGSMIVPLCIVAMLCIKQYVLFDTIYTGSAYVGENLAIRTRDMPIKIKNELMEQGMLSESYFLPPHTIISDDRNPFTSTQKTGISALNAIKKSTGAFNYNHIANLELSKKYVKEFKAVVQYCPQCYLHSFQNTKLYFYPASENYFAKNTNYKGAFAEIYRTYNTVFLGKSTTSPIAWNLLIGFPILLVFGCYKAIENCNKRSEDMARSFTLGYMLFHIIFLSIITIAISYADYNRYRAEFDSFYLVLLGMLLTSCLRNVTCRKNFRL